MCVPVALSIFVRAGEEMSHHHTTTKNKDYFVRVYFFGKLEFTFLFYRKLAFTLQHTRKPIFHGVSLCAYSFFCVRFLEEIEHK